MMYNGKSHHIRRRHNTGTKFLSSGIIPVDYVKSKDNVSDPLTKDLSREGVERTSKGMGLRPKTSQHGGTFVIFLINVVCGVTNPSDCKILNDFKNGLENLELLKWPLKENDPCGSPAWPHVFSSSDRVAQIQVQSLGLKGPLPDSLNELDKLENLGLQVNTLLDILGGWNYPTNLTSEWSGNDPCIGSWLGFSCNFKGEVAIHNLQNKNLTEHKDPFDQDNIVNITVLEDPMMYTAQSGTSTTTSGGIDGSQVIEIGKSFQPRPSENRKKLEDSIITVLEDPKMYIANSRNLVISTQYLWRVTNNFVTENGLGHGGFGVVYKDVTEDESQIIVKRIESSIINHKKLDKFQVELDMISKVLQCHLVSLLGYSVEGNERLLIYEFMSKGALSRHLFRWKILNLELLSQKRKSILL
ncbi:hypothetical protein BC332_16458 [Capsicum chinense]|nr:hypothetical protein BC332_16458 [Capsicum chinense]